MFRYCGIFDVLTTVFVVGRYSLKVMGSAAYVCLSVCLSVLCYGGEQCDMFATLTSAVAVLTPVHAYSYSVVAM
jgi:hypothetical protein